MPDALDPLHVPGVCRFTILGHWLGSGRAVDNIWDIHIDVVGVLTSRSEAIADQAEILVTQWQDDLMGNVATDYVITGVSWVDLNTLTGETGEFPFDGQGTGSSSSISPNVSHLVHKQCTAARGIRSGRSYIGGVPRGSMDDDGNLSDVSSWNTNLASFKGNVEQDAGVDPPNYNSHLVVVHGPTRKFPHKAQTYSDITSLTMDPKVATQRRRLRG